MADSSCSRAGCASSRRAVLVTYRVGRSLGRTLYRQLGPAPSKDDVFLGIMETRELADLVVRLLNDDERVQAVQDVPLPAPRFSRSCCGRRLKREA